MIDFTEIEHSGEDWELFARDFLTEIDFIIETPPNRGSDGGKDILILETIKGNIHTSNFRWLVSCKHYAKSKKSVNETKDELNILERVEAFKADGFLGFYSTVPSSGLEKRLQQLKENGKLNDYKVFDHRLIEKYLLQIGHSRLLMRYFPLSHRKIAPLHPVFGDYIPLKCDVCEKDLLEAMFKESYGGLVAYARVFVGESNSQQILDIYFACKNECDKIKQDEVFATHKATTAWKDLSDLIIPAEFLRFFLGAINRLRDGKDIYSDIAFEKEKALISSLAQKVFREMSTKEYERFLKLYEYGL